MIQYLKYNFLIIILLLVLNPFAIAGEKSASVINEGKNGIGALGRIEPASRVLTLSHDAGPEGARIGKLIVTEGQNVAAGEILAYFSNNIRKEAELKSAKANIEVLNARVKSAEAEVIAAKREFSRSSKLLDKKIISESRIDEAELRFSQANANVAALNAEIIAAEANLLLAQEQLKQTILTAPIGGTIIKIHSFVGERVGDKGVMEMADLTQMDVVAEVYERDISRVKIGQLAQIQIPGFSSDINGKVREISFQVNKNDINNTDPLSDKDNRTIEVRITIPGENSIQLQHLINMQVNVRIL